MSIIYSYPTSQPTLQDLLIGTDVADENATKSFSVQSLVSLINASQGNGIITDVTISTSDVFLTASKTSGIGDPAITYNIGLTSLPTAGLETTQFLRGDNQWVTPTVSAGISVFGNSAQLVTNDVSQFSFIGGGVSTTAGANNSVTVEILEQSSDVSSVVGRSGVSVTPLSGQGDLTITNTGVTQITTGTGITATREGAAVTTGNILLSLDANAVGAGTVTSVFAGPGLRIQSGLATVSPTLAVQYTGAQNVIAQGLNAAVVTQSDQILFNQVSSTPANVKSTTLGTIPMDSLPLVQDYIDSAERGFVSNLTDVSPFDTAVAENIITLEQSQYDGIATKDPNTLYFTTGVVVVPTGTILAINTSNITNNTGVTPIPVTFSGDQPGSTRTGQPGATISPAYSSNIVINTALYAWENGVVPVITNATGVYPATGVSTVASTFTTSTGQNAVLILKPAEQNASTLNTTFTKTFTLNGSAWPTAPANLVTASYTGSPTVDPVINGDTGTNYSNSTEWNVDFTYSGSDYVMSNKSVTYAPVQGNYDGGTVEATLTADFVDATFSANIVIEDLINTNSGADRNTEYGVAIFPNPENGANRYDVPLSTTGGTITVPITHSPFLASGNEQTFQAIGYAGTGGPFFDFTFINPIENYATVTSGPGNTASFSQGVNTLTIGSGTNTAAFTLTGQVAPKNGTSSISDVDFDWAAIVPTGIWVGGITMTAQYRTTFNNATSGWINTTSFTGTSNGAPQITSVSVNKQLGTTVEWRYQLSFSGSGNALPSSDQGLTVQRAFTLVASSTAGGTDSGNQFALSTQTSQSTGRNNTTGYVFYNTTTLATHILSETNTSVSSTININNGIVIQNPFFVQNGISPVAQNSPVNACCDTQRTSDLYYTLGSGSATTLEEATIYSDALALNVLSSGFYQVAGENAGTNASIHIQYTNGVVTGGKTQCAACITAVRYPIQIPAQGPVGGATSGSFYNEVDANRSASFVGYQKNAFNVSNIASTNIFTAWLQKGDGNTDITRIEVGDGVFKYSDTSNGANLAAGSWWASCGAADTNTLNDNPAIGDQNQAFFCSGSGSEFAIAQVTSVSNATYTMVEIAKSFSGNSTAPGACSLDLDPPLFILKNGRNFNAFALQNQDFVFGNQTRTNLLPTNKYYKVSSQTTQGIGGAPVVGRFYLSSNAAFYGVLATSIQPC